MNKSKARPGPRSRGQAMAELAIILPVLLLLMIGGEEVARLAHTGIVASHAAHAGALYGSQSSATVLDNTGMVNAALADGQELGGLSATATHVCTCANGASSPTCAPSDCSGGRLEVYAQVNTIATFTPACSFLGWPTPLTLKRQAIIRARP